jgi:hypothetical protein
VACTHGAKTPAEARERLHAAVESGDGRALYDIVDEQTRWSIDSAFKYHQQCLDLIEQTYPPEVQAREKARFVDGDDVAHFLTAYEARYHLFAALRPRLSSPEGDGITQDKRGRWVFSGLRAQWEDIKHRGSHDLDTVRESAQAFRRAAK